MPRRRIVHAPVFASPSALARALCRQEGGASQFAIHPDGVTCRLCLQRIEHMRARDAEIARDVLARMLAPG